MHCVVSMSIPNHSASSSPEKIARNNRGGAPMGHFSKRVTQTETLSKVTLFCPRLGGSSNVLSQEENEPCATFLRHAPVRLGSRFGKSTTHPRLPTGSYCHHDGHFLRALFLSDPPQVTQDNLSFWPLASASHLGRHGTRARCDVQVRALLALPSKQQGENGVCHPATALVALPSNDSYATGRFGTTFAPSHMHTCVQSHV